MTIDPRELRTVFAVSDTRKVQQGKIEYGGDFWTCDAFNDPLIKKVIIRIPKFEKEPMILPVFDCATGTKLLGFAKPATRYRPCDPAGAQESERISGIHRQRITNIAATAPEINVMAEVASFTATLPQAAEAEACGVLSISDQHRQIGEATAETPEAHRDRQVEEAQKKARKVTARIEQLDKDFRRTG